MRFRILNNSTMEHLFTVVSESSTIREDSSVKSLGRTIRRSHLEKKLRVYTINSGPPPPLMRR